MGRSELRVPPYIEESRDLGADWNTTQAACLPCAGLTAWNALAGLKGLGPASTILVQGQSRIAFK